MNSSMVDLREWNEEMPTVGEARQRRIRKAIFPRKRDAAKSQRSSERVDVRTLHLPRAVFVSIQGSVTAPSLCANQILADTGSVGSAT
jgi:hypothetical protein